MDNFKRLSKKRFEALNEAALSYSTLEEKNVSVLEAFVTAYNNKFGTSFYMDKKLNEIVHAGIIKEGSYKHFEGLRSVLERRGWDISLGESKASTGSTLARLVESELEQAEVILAAQSISDRLQKMAEDLAQMVSDDVLPIADQMKATFSSELAEKWGHTAKESLEKAFNNVTEVKDAIFGITQNLQSELEGGGSAPANDMASFEPEETEDSSDLDLGDEEGGDDLGLGDEEGEDDIDLDLGDEEGEEPLGRAKKESRNYGSKKSLKENLGKRLYNLVYDAPWAKANPKEIARRLKGQDDEFVDDIIQRGEQSNLGGPAKIQYQLAKKEKERRQHKNNTESLTEEMVFVAGRDFEPVIDYKGYTLGRFEHRDDDVRKVDYGIYKFVGEETPNGMSRSQKKYKEVKDLNASPYIGEKEALALFKQAVDTTDLTEDDDPCWKGYRQLGMKMKDGKEVPNCIPEAVVSEHADPSEYVDRWREKGFDINVRKAGGDAQDPHLLFKVQKDGERFEIEEPRTGVYKVDDASFDSFDDAMKHAGLKYDLLEICMECGYPMREDDSRIMQGDDFEYLARDIRRLPNGDYRVTVGNANRSYQDSVQAPASKMYSKLKELGYHKAADQFKQRVMDNAVEEGNAFVHAARQAKKAGKDEFEFDGKTYPVEEALQEDDEAERAIMAMIKGADELPKDQTKNPAMQQAEDEMSTALERNPNLKRAIQKVVGEAVRTVNEDVNMGISLDIALKNASKMYNVPKKKLTEIYMRK
mgnify:CR=1 FL=1